MRELYLPDWTTVLESPYYLQALGLLLSQLEARELEAAWVEGTAMPKNEGCKYALEEDEAAYGRAENP